IRQILSDAAEMARAEEEYWEALAGREWEDRQGTKRNEIPPGLKPGTTAAVNGTAEAVPFQANSEVQSLSLVNFTALPLALQRRLLRRFAEGADLTLDFGHVEHLLRCARGELAGTELP